MTTQLSLYNGALRILRERPLASLTENTPARYALDAIWTADPVKACLEDGLWNFATRSSSFTYSPSVTPAFGLRYAFEKPSDWVRTAGIWSDEYMQSPVTLYRDEKGYWWSDLETLYVSYISDDNEYGNNLAQWPSSFEKYVEHYIALEAGPQITANASMVEVLRKEKTDALKMARNRDAMNQPAQFPPTGSFVSARIGSHTRLDRRDRR